MIDVFSFNGVVHINGFKTTSILLEILWLFNVPQIHVGVTCATIISKTYEPGWSWIPAELEQKRSIHFYFDVFFGILRSAYLLCDGRGSRPRCEQMCVERLRH